MSSRWLEEMWPNRCCHFQGVASSLCRAGISFSSFHRRLPCWGDPVPNEICSKYEKWSQEEAQAELERQERTTS